MTVNRLLLVRLLVAVVAGLATGVIWAVGFRLLDCQKLLAAYCLFGAGFVLGPIIQEIGRQILVKPSFDKLMAREDNGCLP